MYWLQMEECRFLHFKVETTEWDNIHVKFHLVINFIIRHETINLLIIHHFSNIAIVIQLKLQFSFITHSLCFHATTTSELNIYFIPTLIIVYTIICIFVSILFDKKSWLIFKDSLFNVIKYKWKVVFRKRCSYIYIYEKSKQSRLINKFNESRFDNKNTHLSS